MPSKDLTWRLFGEDVTASRSVKNLGDEFERTSNRATGSANKLDKQFQVIGSSAESSLPPIPPMFGLIAAGALLAGPAVGAAAGAVVTLGAAAGVSFLAFKGLQEQMKLGTPIGKQLTSSLSGLTGEFQRLERIAGAGASVGVLGSLKQIKAFLPTLEPLVGSLSQSLGKALNIGTGGLITGLKVMTPLMSDAGHYAEALAQKFADFAASPEFKRFIAYAREELPLVVHDLGDVIGAAVKLGVALQPLGEVALRRLDGLAKVISGLTGPMTALTKAAGGQGGLGGAFSFLEHTINPLSGVMDSLGNKHKKAASTADQLAQSEKDAAAAAALAAAANDNLGKKWRTTGDAAGTATAAIKAQKDALAATTLQMQLQNDAAGLLTQALDKLNGGNLSAAQAQNTFDQALVDERNNIGKASQSLIDAQVKQEKAQDALNKARGNGKTTADQLAAAQAALQKANFNLAAAEDKAGTSIFAVDQKTHRLTDSALKNQGAINGLIQSAEAAAEAYGKQTDAQGNFIHSSEQARQKTIAEKNALIDQLVQMGFTRAEVTRYVDQLFKIPKKIPPTQIDVNDATALARLRSVHDAVNNIPSYVGITIGVNNDVGKAVHDAVNSIGGHAAGTLSAPRGLAWVGEQGPELMSFRGGEQVVPHAKSMAMASSRGGDTYNITVNGALDANGVSQQIRQMLLGLKRTNGGGALGLG